MRSRETSMPLFDRAATEERPRLELNRTVMEEDVPRLRASLQRLYDAMRSGDWFTGPELIPVAGLRYGARLGELKDAGYPFAREHVGEGVWRYRLIPSPTNGVG